MWTFFESKENFLKKRNKFWVPKKIRLLLYGGLISLVSAIVVTYLNNRHIEKLASIDKKFTYVNSYVKDLNNRYYLFIQVFEAIRVKDTSAFAMWSQKFNNARLDWLINISYDSVQFHRYFDNSYDDAIKIINRKINDAGLSAEGYKPDKLYNLQNREGEIDSLLRNFEMKIYNQIDN